MTRRFLQVAVTLGLLAILLWLVDIERVVDRLRQIDPLFSAPALGLLFVQNDLTTWRWSIMLGAFGPTPGHFRMLRIQYLALFAQLFLPSSVGGGAVRTAMLVRAGTELWVAVNSVVLDRLAAVGGLFLMALAFMPAVSFSISSSPRGALLAGASILAVILIAGLVLFKYRPIAFWLELLNHTPVRRIIAPLRQAAPKLIDPGRLILALMISVAGQLVAILAIYVLAKGDGLQVHLLDCVFIMPPVMLLSALPISIAGWGVREGSMVVAFGMLGVSREAAFALSLQFAVLGYLAASPGALAWLWEANRGAFWNSAKPRTDSPKADLGGK